MDMKEFVKRAENLALAIKEASTEGKYLFGIARNLDQQVSLFLDRPKVAKAVKADLVFAEKLKSMGKEDLPFVGSATLRVVAQILAGRFCSLIGVIGGFLTGFFWIRKFDFMTWLLVAIGTSLFIGLLSYFGGRKIGGSIFDEAEMAYLQSKAND